MDGKLSAGVTPPDGIVRVLGELKALVESIDALKKAIEEWARKNDLWSDCRFYSMAEWAARKEPYGNDGVLLTLTTEGPLNHVLNLHDINGNFRYSIKMQEEFRQLVAAHGYWYEMGYSWTVHFYKD